MKHFVVHWVTNFEVHRIDLAFAGMARIIGIGIIKYIRESPNIRIRLDESASGRSKKLNSETPYCGPIVYVANGQRKKSVKHD